MRQMRSVLARFTAVFSRRRRERAFADELESHLQMHLDDNLRAGMRPDQARRDALWKLGGVAATTQAYRDRSAVPIVEPLLRDTRLALRQLARSPVFTLTATLMLALGVGASVAIFAFVDAALIRPLPYPDPAQLVEVTERTPQIPRANLSYPDYLDWARLNTTLRTLDVHVGRAHVLGTRDGSRLVPGARVSAGFFRTLGVVPALGRDFYRGEDRPGAPASAILSHAAWQARFGGRADVIGQTILLHAIPHVIVGVLPRTFQFAPRGAAEIWTPLQPTGPCELRRSCHALSGVARLKPGVTVDTALAEMRAIAARLERQYPDSNRDQGALVQPLSRLIVGEVRPLLLVLLGGAGLLLAIGCVNVSSLLLVRSEGRRRELAVRSALGASRGRLVAQMVTEAVVLVAIGSMLGVAVAGGAMRLLVSLIPEDMLAGLPFLVGLDLNAHVVAFAAAVAVLAIVLFTAASMSRLSFARLRDGIGEGGRGAVSATWQRLGFKLVVVELATATVLLAGAALLGQSLYRLLSVDLGFRPEGVATMQLTAPRARYATDEQMVALGRDVLGRVTRLPGVEAAGLSSVLPVSFNGNTDWIRFVGRPYNGEHNEVNQRDVSVDYFRSIGAALVKGRAFSAADNATAPKVVIINAALARQYFLNQDPIGQRFGDTELSPDSIKEIVGIVDDIREGPLNAAIWPAVYYPFEQSPDSSFALVVRTARAEHALLSTMAAVIRELDPDIGTTSGAIMRDRIADSPVAYLQRSAAWLVGGFAAIALLLGAVGLYGVVAYSVSHRTREIGVRLALGAERRSVYRLVLGEAGMLAVIGIALGLAVSVSVATLMRTLLFGIPPWDVPTLLGVAVVLSGAALLASYVPARRAASVSPMEALRSE